MKRSSGPRKTAKLSASFHQRLNMYALAAGAAGVGMLALAQFAEAEIIYTKAHVKLTPNHKFHLDLNHDGIKDFELDDIASGTSAFLEIHPLQMGKCSGSSKNRLQSFRWRRCLASWRIDWKGPSVLRLALLHGPKDF